MERQTSIKRRQYPFQCLMESKGPQFKEIFQKSPSAQIITKAGRIRLANRAASELLANSSDPESLVDTPLEAYFRKWNASNEKPNGAATFPLASPSEKGPQTCEVHRSSMGDGESLWILQPIGLAPSENESALYGALDRSTDGIISLECDGGSDEAPKSWQIRFINRAARNILGIDSIRVEGKALGTVCPIFQDLELERFLEQATSKSGPSSRESTFELDEETKTVVFSTRNASHSETILVFEDVTRARRIEQELESNG